MKNGKKIKRMARGREIGDQEKNGEVSFMYRSQLVNIMIAIILTFIIT